MTPSASNASMWHSHPSAYLYASAVHVAPTAESSRYTNSMRKIAPNPCCLLLFPCVLLESFCNQITPASNSRIRTTYRKLRKKFSRTMWPASAAWPLQEAFPLPRIQNQLQSPFFRKLSPEIRIVVYKAALSCPKQYLHVCRSELFGAESINGHRVRSLAHYRCVDMDSLYPSWQHVCFGEEIVEVYGETAVSRSRYVTATRDNLIAMLLTCRLVYVVAPTLTSYSATKKYIRYSEALEFLYKCNIFHFRGPLSLPAFRDSIPRLQWLAIRHIRIATAFMAFYRSRSWPESTTSQYTYPNWIRICECLNELPNIRTLIFDISAPDHYISGAAERHSASVLMSIFEPFKDINARDLRIELNNVPNEVRQLISPPGNFSVVFKERSLRWDVNCEPLFDAIHMTFPSRNR